MQLVAVDGSYDDTERAARAYCAERPDVEFLSSYNDAAVIAGQATIALELVEQWPALEAVCCSGWRRRADRRRRDGPEVGRAACRRGRRGTSGQRGDDRGARGWADDADRRPWLNRGRARWDLDADSITYALAKRVVDEIVLVEEDEIRAAVRLLYERAGIVVEPSGAAAVAGLRHSSVLAGRSKIACVITGRNIAPTEHRRLID